MDRISQLPESIVHHILTCLDASNEPPVDLVRMSESNEPPVDLVRISVSSKTWFRLTASFPILDFNILNFGSRQSFFNYVDYATSRFCLQNVPAHKLTLIATLHEPAELDVVNRCLESLLKNGVTNLEIDITNSLESPSATATAKPTPRYRLPNVLLSVSVLKYLTIKGCDLPSSLMLDDIKFKSLTQLRIENTHIDDEVIKYLTTTCPLLQLFIVTRCHGFKTFCVSGHQNLQRIFIDYSTSIERIDIEAPNLSCLFVLNRVGRRGPQMNLASCQKLTTMTYFGEHIPNSNAFTHFLSTFPIENLCLVTKYNFNNQKFSSHSLRTLTLHSKCDLEQLEFDTPNLALLTYTSSPRLLPVVDKRCPPVKDLTHLKGCMKCYLGGYTDDLWFQKLRLFLGKKNGFKVFNLYFHAKYSEKFTDLEKLKGIELPPYELENVELELDIHNESSVHVAFVDAVLWCCRPRSLTLRSNFSLTDFEDVVKFTYEKLLQQEDEGHTKIQIVSPSSSKSQKQFRDMQSSPSMEGKTISFIKEEVVQKEAGNQRFANMEIF